MEKADCIDIIITCIVLALYLIIGTPIEKVPNFDGYRTCLAEKQSNCDTQFKEVPEFLKKHNLNLTEVAK